MGNNSSQQRREKAQRKKEREARAMVRRKRGNVIAGIVAGILGAVILVFGGVWIVNKIVKSRSDLKKVAVRSKYYELTLGDMQYLYFDNYNDFMTDNSENVNIDIEKSLKTQYYDEQKKITWYDYFLQQAKDNAESYILLASAAKDEGYTLTEKEKTEIDELIDAFEEYGEKEGYTLEGYIEYAYGEGITEKNIRRCQEIKKIATRYYTAKVDEKTLAYKDEDYINFLEKNFDEYAGSACKIDYTYFSFEAQFEEGFTDAQKEESRNNAYKLAEELRDAGSEEKFDAIILKYIETAKLAEEQGMSAEEYLDTIYKSSAYYNQEDDFAKWAFSDERKVGDTNIFEVKENVFVAYYMNKTIYFDEKPTKNFRQILLEIENYSSAEATRKTALNLISEWENGEATEESFKALVKEYSTDVTSVENEGLYMYVREGELGLEDFDEWLFDENRKPGSVGLVKSEKSYHILYMCGDGVPTWQAALVQPMQEDAYNELKAPLVDKYNVTFNNKLINKISS